MQFETNKKPIYPFEDWAVTETEFIPKNNYRGETIFAQGNGYIGARGTFEEDYGFDTASGMEGNFLSGFYESQPIRYGELGVGFPTDSQTMLNVTNAKRLELTVEGERFSMLAGTLSEYRRRLDLGSGVVTRELVWTSPNGKALRLETTRLVSFERPNVIARRYRVTPLNFSGSLTLSAKIDGDVENHTRDTNPLIDYGPYGRVLLPVSSAAAENGCFVRQKTENTGLEYICFARHLLSSEFTAQYSHAPLCADASYTVEAEQNRPVTLDSFIVYAEPRDFPGRDLTEVATALAAEAAEVGVDALCAEQQAFLDRYWQSADVQVDGDDALQQGLRFNLFHLLQGAARDGKRGMCAKCLTGEGYEGHYFWDTEMYMLPFFSCTAPDISKKLLDFRYSTLDRARERARQMSGKGALYPWRTINGAEASAYYPQGTAQYHINADIAYALCQYLSITGDVEYLLDKGAEILFETARMWADLGAFTPLRGGRFCICDVTGPDEYTSVVDNNCYTNLMARENLRAAAAVARWMEKNHPDRLAELSARIEPVSDEIALWERAAELMYLPYNDELGIYGQDDTYLYKKPIDLSSIPKDDFSLLMHSHPLVVYRYRLSKQTDFVLALFLLGHLFSDEEKKKNFDFYETTTMHSSSLSLCVAGIMAAELGEREKADEYLSCTARLDLDDYHDNVYAGVHAANMAGCWMGLVYGYGGMRIHDDYLGFAPYLPESLRGYRFTVRYRGRAIAVDVSAGRVRYRLIQGEPLSLWHCGEKLLLSGDAERSLEVRS